jgi:lysozyme family protein
MAMPQLTTALKSEYENLFKTCKINAPRADEVDALTARVVQNKDRYAAVGDAVGVPWYVVGVIHLLEGSLRFDTHLYNGDPLTARTVHYPPGMPKSGKPPFTWEQSATGALEHVGLDAWNDWSVGGTLYALERYNGPGYINRKPPIHSPYVWSFSQHYTRGKYVKDGVFSGTAVSQQCGAGVILRRLVDKRLIKLGPPQPAPQPVEAGLLTVTNPPLTGPEVRAAQQLLAKNKYGSFDPGDIDGEYGELSAAAVWQAKWMLGYPEQLLNRNFGPKLKAYLEGTPLPAAYAKARAKRLMESKSEAGIRKQIVKWATWGVDNTGKIGYSQTGPRLEALGSPGRLPLTTDCSAFATLCYNWAGAPNPNEAGPYDAKHLTYTGTMLDCCRHIPAKAAKPGDLVIWTGGDAPKGSHVCVLIESGKDPLLVSHGQEKGPVKIRFSAEDAYQRGAGYTTVSWLSAFK